MRGTMPSYYALGLMRRVVVTGLGAVTPLGHDARSTWEAAVAGKSGVDWIRAFDADRLSGSHRLRGEGLRARGGRRAQGRTPARAERRAGGRGRAGSVGRCGRRRGGPCPGRHSRGLRDRGSHGRTRPERGTQGARIHACVAVVPSERARRLGERPDRHRSRPAWPELRPGLGVCDRVTRRRRGRRADPPR